MRRDGLAISIIAFVVLLPMRGLWRHPGAPMEEGFMLVFPEQVLRGAIPNRDFLHLYGPGSLWVLAGAFKAFGVSMWTERTIGLLQILGLIAGVYALTRPWGRRIAVGAACTTAILILPPAGLTAMAWVGGIALGVWAVYAVLHGRPLLAGLLAGGALLYRPDLIIAMTLGFAVVFGVLTGAQRRRLALGSALGLSPFLVHIAMAGIGDAFFGMVIQPVFQLRAGRHLPMPPSWTSLDGFLQGAEEVNPAHWPVSWPPKAPQLTLWLILLLAASIALVVAGILRTRRDPATLRGRSVLAMSVFACGLLLQAVQRPDSTHIAWVSCVTFGFLPVALAELLRLWRPSLPAARRALVAVGFPTLCFLVLVPHFTYRFYGDRVIQTFGKHREVYTITNMGRSFYYGRRDAVDAVTEMLPVVNQIARSGDKLFVGPGDLRKTPYSEAFLYYLLPQTDPGTRYIEMDPGVANSEDSSMAADLASSDIAILSSIRDDWVEPNSSRDFGSDESTAVLARDFCLVGSFGKGLFGRGLYELYERCDRR